MQNIGYCLYQIRLDKDLTQAELARKAGIPQSALSNIEKGNRDLTMATFLNLCHALEVSPSDVFMVPSNQPRRVKPIAFTRSNLERLAKAVLYEGVALSSDEREIAGLLRKIIPGIYRGRLSARQVREAWYRLRELFKEGEIRTLAERVGDEKIRMKAA